MDMFSTLLSKIPSVKIIDTSIDIVDYIAIDISKENKALYKFDVSSSKDWEEYLEKYLEKNNAKVAYGGYLEVRDIYNRSNYFKNLEYQRNIHLGIDLWTDSDTTVLAALEGEIHSFQNNKNHGDYGPTIILKHTLNDYTFYTLYGHLSLSSILDIEEGQHVKQGDVIGYIGASSINGDYAPHLHFQIILDIQKYRGDYPGVCTRNELTFFKQNCPNPNLLLKIKE